MSAETATIWQKLRTVVPGLKMKGIDVSLFGDDGIFVESNMIKLRSQNPAAYAATQEQEVGANASMPVQKRRNSLYNGQF